MLSMRRMGRLLRATVTAWQRDKASRLAAALAYYTAFSLAPVLVIVIAIASFFFGREAVQGEVVAQLQGLIGQDGADMVQTMILNARQTADQGLQATLVSLGLLIIGASGVFAQLQDALNTVWNVTPKPNQGLVGLLRTRLLSFGMVLVIGFLLLVSLLLSAALSAATHTLGSDQQSWSLLWQIVNQIISLGIITLLFALIYKILPDAEIAWHDVWTGAAITALLFTLGKWLIGLYLGNSSIGSTYGAAGSFAVLLVWIYYSAQIMLLGAEFTQVYANRYGSHITPADDGHLNFSKSED